MIEGRTEPMVEESTNPLRPRFRKQLSGRVLLADDDAEVREMTAQLLAASGLQVEVAGDGEEAWNLLGRAHFDLLITDHNMPQLTGLRLIQRLRQHGNKIPAIVISGGVPFDEEYSLGLGETEVYVPKPFLVGDLLRAIGEILQPTTVMAQAS